MKRYTIKGATRHGSHYDHLNSANVLDAMGEDQMQVSDGYHTMDELYEHRHTLFIALCRWLASETTKKVWRSKRHFLSPEGDEEKMLEGMFILGIGKEKGEQITYHLPIDLWGETEFAETLENAPEWDGHTSSEVLERIGKL